MWRQVGKSDSTVLRERMIVNSKLEKLRNTLSISRYYNGICPEVLRKSWRIKNDPCSHQNSSRVPADKSNKPQFLCQFSCRIWKNYKIHKERISNQAVNWCVKRLMRNICSRFSIFLLSRLKSVTLALIGSGLLYAEDPILSTGQRTTLRPTPIDNWIRCTLSVLPRPDCDV